MSRSQGLASTLVERARNGGGRVILGVAAPIVALVVAYAYWPAFHQFANEAIGALATGDRARISAWVDELGPWAPAAIIVAMTLQMFLVVVPSVGLIAIAVLAYGPWWGSALALAAVMVASSAGYALGRFLAPRTVGRLIRPGTAETLRSHVERYGIGVVFVFRLSPFLSNDAISFVAGMMRMSFWRFLLATVAGIAPLVGGIAYLGEQVEGLEQGLAWASGVSLLLLAGYVVFELRRRRSGARGG